MPEPADHAPLPWTIEPYVDAIRIHDANGDMVCDLSDRRIDLTGMPPENARLIVRSANCHADLLAACERALGMIDVCVWGGMSSYRSIKSAIAKAKGVPTPSL